MPSPDLPFARLNLRFNPFGEMDLAVRAEFAVVDVAGVLARLREPDFAVQVIGEKGHGKTTHLVAIRRHFPDAAYVHVGEGERPRIPRSDPLFLDEVQRISLRRRRRIFRRRASLVLGTHEDFAAELAAAGRAVETIVAGRDLDEGRLCAMLNRRIEYARRTPGPVPTVDQAACRELLRRHGRDIRAMEGELYERFQELDAIRHFPNVR